MFSFGGGRAGADGCPRICQDKVRFHLGLERQGRQRKTAPAGADAVLSS